MVRKDEALFFVLKILNLMTMTLYLKNKIFGLESKIKTKHFKNELEC